MDLLVVMVTYESVLMDLGLKCVAMDKLSLIIAWLVLFVVALDTLLMVGNCNSLLHS